MSNFMRGEKGFTLLEIMVSMAIMAIALVTIIQLFSGALRSAKVSHDYTLAVREARKKMDDVLEVTTLEKFDELQKTGDEFESDMMEGSRWEISDLEPYQIPEGLREDIEHAMGMSVEDLPNKLYQISVRVSWASGLREKEVRFTTIKMLEEED